MTKASDNAYPSILITEGTEPSAPAAGKQRLYIDSTSHKLKRTDSSGTDVTIEGAASGAVTSSGLTMATARILGRTTAATGAIEEIAVGSGLSLAAGALTATGGAGDVATDAIWDAKGDDAVGTGENTAARLAVGANGTVKTAASGETTGQKWAYPPGYQLAHGTKTSATNCTGRTGAGATQIIAGSAVTYDGGAVMIEWHTPWAYLDAYNTGHLCLYVDGSFVDDLQQCLLHTGDVLGLNGRAQYTPSAGSHTLALYGYMETAGTFVVGAGSGLSAAFIRITKV